MLGLDVPWTNAVIAISQKIIIWIRKRFLDVSKWTVPEEIPGFRFGSSCPLEVIFSHVRCSYAGLDIDH